MLCSDDDVIITQLHANSAFHPSGVGKWVPASAGKAKAAMVHSVSGCMQGVQVKLWDPLRMHAIPERLRGAFTTRRYANPRLSLHVCWPVGNEGAAKWRTILQIRFIGLYRNVFWKSYWRFGNCHYFAKAHLVSISVALGLHCESMSMGLVHSLLFSILAGTHCTLPLKDGQAELTWAADLVCSPADSEKSKINWSWK